MDPIWQHEYERLVREGIATGRIQRLPGGQERRVEPRFRLQQPTVRVQLETDFTVVDLSVDGISFHVPYTIPTGQLLKVVIQGAFLVELEPIACTPNADPAAESQGAYLLHCRIPKRDDGLQLLVMLHELGGLVTGPR